MNEPKTLGEFGRWLEEKLAAEKASERSLGETGATPPGDLLSEVTTVFERVLLNAAYRIEGGARKRSTNGHWAADPNYRAAVSEELRGA